MSLYCSGIALIVATFLLSGCSFFDHWVYRPDINQGNYITQEQVNKLQVGQTKEQVMFIMGTPMLESVFEDNIWYYVFRQLPQYGKVSQETYTILFDNKGNVTDIKTSAYNAKSLAVMDEAEPASDDYTNE